MPSQEPPPEAIELALSAHRALSTQLDSMGRRGVDPTAPSLLPGWTVGHVLTHIARNADGFRRLLAGADRGDAAEMYPGGLPARNAAIDAGATRAWAALAADVRASAAALDAQFLDQSRWDGGGTGSAGQTFLARDVPFLRSREVFVHAADLGDAGFGPPDWPERYVSEELDRLGAVWRQRHPGEELPAAVGARSRLDRVRWLLGRLDIAGTGPAGTL